MAYKKQILYISAKELLAQLKITPQQLDDIEKYFDKYDDDEWELTPGKDYRVVVQSKGLREYTLSGAYTIAKYLEKHPINHGFFANFFENIKEWFTGAKKKIRQNFVRQRILDNSSSLLKRNDQYFLSRSDVLRIFETRSDYLSKMDEEARKSSKDPLEKYVDYDEIDGVVYYSIRGIYKLALAFYECIKAQNRKDWCQDVGVVIIPQIDTTIKQIIERNKRIPNIKKFVRENIDKKTCQVTQERQVAASNFKLAVHHLYSVNQYPHLADDATNMVTIKDEIHNEFHDSFMGGKSKPCTIDDFLSFLAEKYPDNYDLQINLNGRKLKLGDQQPLGKRAPHVLYLPLERVT